MPQLIAIGLVGFITWALAGRPSLREALEAWGLAPRNADAADQLRQPELPNGPDQSLYY